jgi:hypothetical protein
MKGTPEKTVILHWDEYQTSWATMPWGDWVRFRGVGEGEQTVLVGAEPGEHYFLVCILGDRGELCHAIPHRYVMSADGRLVHGFDGLEAAEREESSRIEALLMPSVKEARRYKELGARGLSANLPPPRTVQPLLRAIPGLAGAQHGSACWHFLAAIGICESSGRPH